MVCPEGQAFPHFEPELKGHAPKGMTGFASGPRAGGLDVRTLLSFQRPRRTLGGRKKASGSHQRPFLASIPIGSGSPRFGSPVSSYRDFLPPPRRDSRSMIAALSRLSNGRNGAFRPVAGLPRQSDAARPTL